MFSSEFVNSSRHTVQAAVSWDSNEVLAEKPRCIRDWRGRVMPLSPAPQTDKCSGEPLSELYAPLVLTKEVQENEPSFEITGELRPLCPHEEALRGSFFTFTESTTKSFIGQSIISLLQTITTSNVALKSSEVIMNFLKSSTEFFSKSSTTCIQVLKTKKQHCQNLYFRSLGYGTMFAPSSKICDIKIEKHFLHQMKAASEKISRVSMTGDRDISE